MIGNFKTTASRCSELEELNESILNLAEEKIRCSNNKAVEDEDLELLG